VLVKFIAVVVSSLGCLDIGICLSRKFDAGHAQLIGIFADQTSELIVAQPAIAPLGLRRRNLDERLPWEFDLG
jgi:hypothetical protein